MHEDNEYWQEMPNAIWYTEKELKCDCCNKKVNSVYEIVIDINYTKLVCSNCFTPLLKEIFDKNSSLDYVYLRVIEQKSKK